MTDYNPCQGCDFFNKPYWSILSPCKNCPKQFTGGFVTTTITNVPSVEYAPVRHGRWVIEKRHAVSRNPYMDDNYFASATCSECGFCIHAETKSFGYPDLNTTNYCPNCGAKMDGDSHEA